MLTLKPFIRITILSLILTFLLIYLGVRYHWGDQLKAKSEDSIELSIPDKKTTNTNIQTTVENNTYNPKIINNESSNSLLESMNKEQIAEHCINLLSKELKDPLTLELATVNCVVSNYQETFQNSHKLNNELEADIKKNRLLYKQQCNQKYNQIPQYSLLEKQLLVGICVSDKLNIR